VDDVFRRQLKARSDDGITRLRSRILPTGLGEFRPAARWTAALTVPPGTSAGFEATTIASTVRVVMSTRAARCGAACPILDKGRPSPGALRLTACSKDYGVVQAAPPAKVSALIVALAVAPPFWPVRKSATAVVSLPAPA